MTEERTVVVKTPNLPTLEKYAQRAVLDAVILKAGRPGLTAEDIERLGNAVSNVHYSF